MVVPLGKMLREVRKRHGKTQKKVAECLGISESEYRHIEHGRRSVPDYLEGRLRWIRDWEVCVDATEGERESFVQYFAREIIVEFSVLLDDRSGRQGQRHPPPERARGRPE